MTGNAQRGAAKADGIAGFATWTFKRAVRALLRAMARPVGALVGMIARLFPPSRFTRRRPGRSQVLIDLPPRNDPRFSLRRRSPEVFEVAARGPLIAVTQLGIDAVRELGSTVGVVVVEYRGGPREWLASGVPRAAVLEALLALRDLLGAGAVDVAVHSAPEHMEVILDRHGILEIRAGAWHEPRVRSLLAREGFSEDPRVTILPVEPFLEYAWTAETGARFRRVRERLRLAEPAGSGMEGAV